MKVAHGMLSNPLLEIMSVGRNIQGIWAIVENVSQALIISGKW